MDGPWVYVDGEKMSRLEYMKRWLRESDQKSRCSEPESELAPDTGLCPILSEKSSIELPTAKKQINKMPKKETNIRPEERRAENMNETKKHDSEKQMDLGSTRPNESDIMPTGMPTGEKSDSTGLDVIPPTDLSVSSESLRQDVSTSMSLIDTTARDLHSLMRKVAQPIIDEDQDFISHANLDRVKIAAGVAREIKELIKVKVDAARVVKDMIQ